MIPYEVCVTAVSDRVDLAERSMISLAKRVDQYPERALIHVDVRDESPWPPPDAVEGIECCYRLPPVGMGLAMLWLFENAKTEYVLYTQEDWLVLRDLPVRRTLELMDKHSLHHVRWNKRDTLPAKHDDNPDKRWPKVEVTFDEQVMCISDHWYTQTSMWRVSEALPIMREIAPKYPQAHEFVARFNHAMNKRAGYKGRQWCDPGFRHEKIKTYIWGPVGEPQYVKHIGSTRGTGNIKNHYKEI